MKNIYFIIKTNKLSLGGHILPIEWSTKGWLSKDGKPGYYKDFAGTLIGNASEARVFRIGMDFHFKLKYKDNKRNSKQFPKKIPVSIIADKISTSEKGLLLFLPFMDCIFMSTDGILFENLTTIFLLYFFLASIA